VSGSCAAVWSVTRSKRPPLGRGRPHAGERVVERVRPLVEVTRLDPPLDPRGVDLDAEDRRAGHRRRERLRATHPAEPGREHGPAGKVGRAEVLLPGGGEGLECALEDPLRADVDPRARGHLPVHRQPERLQPPELVPGRPARDEQRVRDQDSRRVLMRAEDADRLAALHEQRLVVAQAEQRRDDRAQRVMRARRAARAAVDDKPLRMLGHLGVEVVEQHPQRRLRLPRARVERRPARRADPREVAA
jgi:hypothetical protein